MSSGEVASGALTPVKKASPRPLERAMVLGAAARPLSPVRVHAVPLAVAALVVLGTGVAAAFATKGPPPFAPVHETDEALLFEPLPAISVVRPAPIVPKRTPPPMAGVMRRRDPPWSAPPPVPTQLGPTAVFTRGEGAR